MGRGRKPSKGKKIRPHFWVFCEGQTEEAYFILNQLSKLWGECNTFV